MDQFPRQSHLGRNAENMLIIPEAAARNSRKREPIGEAFIFRLPDEILDSIIKHATSERWQSQSCSESEHTSDNTMVQALSLVCRRFKHIAQPLLYRNIRFRWPIAMAPPSRPVVKLHRTLSCNPALRQHVRLLAIHVPDIPSITKEDKYDILKDLATWLTRVRCLYIHGGFEGDFHKEHTWRLIRTFSQNMKEMAHIALSRESWGLYLDHIMANLSLFPKLKRLSLHGISEWKENRPAFGSVDRRRSAPITSLSLSDYEESAQSTASLLMWPKALTHFEFGSFYNNPNTMDYPMFESWLIVHRDTLKSVDIGYLSKAGSNRLFNATLFPNLESLKLSRWQQGRTWQSDELIQFTADDANVLGPKLKFFGWDFGIYDQHSEDWNAFGEGEEAWVTALAKTAIAQKRPLKTIRICFAPEYWGSSKQDGYPWDRIDRVRDEICKPNGIELNYTKPTILKWAWLEYLEETERANRDEREGGLPGVEATVEEESGEEMEGKEAEEIMEPGYYGRDIREFFAPVQRPDA